MIDLSKDTQSLSHFKRNTTELLAKMKQNGQPVVLTIHGKAELVVQEATAYQRLLELAGRAEMVDFLKKSKEDADLGRTVPAREFLESLGQEE